MNHGVFFLCLLMLIFNSQTSYGQHEKILNKTYAQRYREIQEVYIKAIEIPDSASAFREANVLKELAIKHGDSDLELETELLKAYYLTVWHKKETVLIQKTLQRLIDRAASQQNLQINVRAHKVLGDYYWNALPNYELGFETYMILEQLLQKISARELPDKMYPLQNMAQAYHNFSDYRKALNLFNQILNLEVNLDKTGGENSAMFSMGMIYRQLGNLDSSDYFYRKIVQNTSSANYATWEGIAYGGLGQNCYLRGKYNEAIPLLQLDVDQALKNKDYGLAAGSSITLADIFLKQNALVKAEQYALRARKFLAMVAPDRYKHHQNLYAVLSKIYAAKGMTRLVGPYLDSAIFAKDSMTRAFNAMQMIRARQKIELQEHRAEMEEVDADKRLKALELNMLLVIVILILAGAGYVSYNLRRRHEQKQLEQENEIKRQEQELANATWQLNEFAKNISDKSRLIEQLEVRQGGPDAEVLCELRKSTILTQDDWEYFKKLFEKVHSGYLYRLKQKFPDLTQAEIRFIVLTKLGLGYQEMSSTLGISSQAVRTTKYRLLKKINLPDDRGLDEFMTQI